MTNVIGIECHKLHEFVDGELRDDEAERFRDHLAACERCGKDMPRLLELIAIADDSLGGGVTGDVDGEVMEGVDGGVMGGATGAVAGGGVIGGVAGAVAGGVASGASAGAVERAGAAGGGSAVVGAVAPALTVAVQPAAAQVPSVTPLRRRSSRVAAMAAAAGVVAAAAAAVLVLRPGAEREPEMVAFAGLSANRKVEVRLSYRGAAGHRPYNVMRGDIPRDDVTHGVMARLEAAGDRHGLAVASLLRGDRAGARSEFERAGRSNAVDVDRAALDILDGSDGALDHALTLLDGVLASEPNNMAARWNRALVLGRLGLPMIAARELDRVEAAGEPGWAGEAAGRARSYRGEIEPRRSAWRATDDAGARWIAGDGPIQVPPGAPRGWLRFLFYDAVRAAGTRERVEALLPLAHQIDRQDGGDALTRYVRSVAAADFRVRGPLAAAYREYAVAGGLDDKAIEQLAARMRSAGAIDLWMGLLGRAKTIAHHLADYRAAADALGDPWFIVMAEHEEAMRAIAAGNRLDGERRLLRAGERAARERLVFRRLRIEEDLAQLYLALRRYPEAERVASKAIQDARAAGEWGREKYLIEKLAEASRFRHTIARTRAYLNEFLEREPKSCPADRYARQALANLAMMELQPEIARRELAAAPLCGEPITVLGAITWADLYRFPGTGVDVDGLRAGLAARRAIRSATGDESATGDDLWADHIEGRLVIEADRTAGQALLRKAIAGAAERTGDAATKVRGHSFSILALDAGRAGEHDAVFALLAEELGGPAPVRCAVGVAMEDERAIVVVRGADGTTAGRYDAPRSPRSEIAPLVRDTAVARLEGCDEVVVLARSPVAGTSRLLPEHLAWSYRLRGAADRPIAAAPASRLVVADTEPPAHLELPALRPYAGGGGDARILRRAEATPERVRSAMRDATIIELHAHGFADRGLSDASYLALTTDRDGRYALTADEVRATELRGAPLVILAACHAADATPFIEQSPGLPDAFMQAGARAVLASPAVVDDTDAAGFFGAVLARIAAGASPATAVRDERVRRSDASASPATAVRDEGVRESDASAWRADVIVYQ